MASVRIKFQPIAPDCNDGTLSFQIIHLREARRISTGITISADDWDADHQRILATTPEARSLQLLIDSQREAISSIICSLDKSGAPYTVVDVLSAYRGHQRCPSFNGYARKVIARCLAMNSVRISVAYSSSIRRFNTFCGNSEMLVDQLSPEIIEDFQHWLHEKGICRNTISFYMRNLRAIYNRAVREGLTPDRRPFANVFTGIERTRKRAISDQCLRKIKNLDLSAAPHLCKVRDLFMLSFYCMGISFVDLAFLKKSDISGNRISYRRSKTKQTISFTITSKIRTIIKKYAAAPDSEYLLDIIEEHRGDRRRQYLTALNLINRHLKKIGKMAGISEVLTSYVARHSWASLAKSKNVGLSVISDALGHENEHTTLIYLDTVGLDCIDKANALVTRDL